MTNQIQYVAIYEDGHEEKFQATCSWPESILREWQLSGEKVIAINEVTK